jgi:hypothetical protein
LAALAYASSRARSRAHANASLVRSSRQYFRPHEPFAGVVIEPEQIAMAQREDKRCGVLGDQLLFLAVVLIGGELDDVGDAIAHWDCLRAGDALELLADLLVVLF